jgi:hypothetical protein
MTARSVLRCLTETGIAGIERIAPSVAAYADWLDPRKHGSWGGPMNGQPGRRLLTRAIAAAFDPQAVIETGTYRGATTQFLWDVSGVPVWTAEVSPRYAAFARWRFTSIRDVTVCQCDSRAFLRQLALDRDVPKARTLFYLDAHWGGDLPLREELSIIFYAWRDPVVMVDDFEVPGDSGYGFDDYGPGKRLTLSYLPTEEMDSFVPLFPSLRSQDEQGLRRGCVVIASTDRADDLLTRRVPLRRVDAV